MDDSLIILIGIVLIVMVPLVLAAWITERKDR